MRIAWLLVCGLLSACAGPNPAPTPIVPPAPLGNCTAPAVWFQTYDDSGRPTGGYCHAYGA